MSLSLYKLRRILTMTEELFLKKANSRIRLWHCMPLQTSFQWKDWQSRESNRFSVKTFHRFLLFIRTSIRSNVNQTRCQ